eukprot:567822-Pleurochrysis_carterae.AAC.1
MRQQQRECVVAAAAHDAISWRDRTPRRGRACSSLACAPPCSHPQPPPRPAPCSIVARAGCTWLRTRATDPRGRR